MLESIIWCACSLECTNLSVCEWVKMAARQTLRVDCHTFESNECIIYNGSQFAILHWTVRLGIESAFNKKANERYREKWRGSIDMKLFRPICTIQWMCCIEVKQSEYFYLTSLLSILFPFVLKCNFQFIWKLKWLALVKGTTINAEKCM